MPRRLSHLHMSCRDRFGGHVPLIVACGSTFLLLAYSTIVTVAMPTIADDLHSDFGALQWVIDVYMIALAALLIPLGAVGDRIGRRELLIWSLVVFAVASLACGLAPNVVVLVLARLVQGVAGAALFATTLPLLEASYAGRARSRAFGIWGAVSGLAAAVGNVSGGLLSALGWRTVFLAAIPIALGTAALTAAFVPTAPIADRGPLNIQAMALLATSIGGLIVTVLIVADHGITGYGILALLACGACLVVFIIGERRRPERALIGSVLLGNPTFRVAIVVGGVYYFAAFGALPAVSSWLQTAGSQSAIGTALILSIQPVAFFLTSALLGVRLGTLEPSRAFGVGLLLCGLGCLLLAGPAVVAGWVGIVPAMLLTGVGAGIISPVLPAAAMHDVPASRTGVAAGAVNAARQFGISVGIAVCAILVRIHQPTHDDDQWPRTLVDIAAVTGLACLAGLVVIVGRARRRSRSRHPRLRRHLSSVGSLGRGLPIGGSTTSTSEGADGDACAATQACGRGLRLLHSGRADRRDEG